MFVRKKTKLRIAYCLLALGSFSVIVFDTHLRSDFASARSEAQRSVPTRTPVPLPITPLALSPFPEARPGYHVAYDSAAAISTQASAKMLEKATRSSSAWFLTVAVKVDSGTKAVALNRGTKVQLVREQDGKFLVRRNGTDFLIEKTQVTDNIASLGKLVGNSS